jgi:hypothetical protein
MWVDEARHLIWLYHPETLGSGDAPGSGMMHRLDTHADDTADGSAWASFRVPAAVQPPRPRPDHAGTPLRGRPGARKHAASWIDSAGSLFLHGGVGCERATGGDCEMPTGLQDTWVFRPQQPPLYDIAAGGAQCLPVNGPVAPQPSSEHARTKCLFWEQTVPQGREPSARPHARVGRASWVVDPADGEAGSAGGGGEGSASVFFFGGATSEVSWERFAVDALWVYQYPTR